MTRSSRLVAAALALAFLALHLPYIPSSLEDVDSINFALGIRDFDVAEHRPHPPGYPIFVLAAKIVSAFAGSETLALSLLGIVCGALSAFALVALFGAIETDRRTESGVVAAALLVVAAPLVWITAARPLSDMPGLAAVLVLQWIIVRAPTAPAILVAACLAGVGAGIRSQVVWLTVPLIALTIARHEPSTRLRVAAISLGGYVAGVLVWAVPLVALSGGPGAYWSAIAFQGGADLSGVTMLWSAPTPRQFLSGIEHGFLAPWAWWPLAFTILALAAVGTIRLLLRSPRVLVTLAAAFAPYLVFNMLLQETVTTRYALPLVVPAAYLAGRGALALSPSFGVWMAAGLAVVGVSLGQASLVAYSTADAPAFRMLTDMRAAQSGERTADGPVLAMHRRQELDLRRPLQWLEPAVPAFAARLPAPPRLEWLELVKYWNGGGRAPVWFVSDPLRSDLALVHHRAPRASYRWPLRFPQLIGGVRPNGMDWHELRSPAWYLGEGWALTPEAAGVAGGSDRGPGRGGSEGWIRRTAGRATLMIGGRHHPGGEPTARVRVSIDGRLVDETEVAAGFFLRMLRLPAGTLDGAGDYAAITVSADSDRVAIEQFDAQPAGTVVFGFGDGWHEHEYTPSTGEQWRWTSDRATIRIRAEQKALSLRIRGESESEGKPRVVIRAGERIIAEETVGRWFIVTATIPADAVAQDESTITIETDRSFVPADTRWRSQDRRRLGLKIYECEITPAS